MKIYLENPVPCPFCGSQRIVKGERYFAMCVDCGATGPERNADASVRKFVGDWNTRYGFAASPDVTSPLETEGGTAIQRIAVVGEAATVCDVCQREVEEKPYHVETKLCHCCMGVLYDQRRVPNDEAHRSAPESGGERKVNKPTVRLTKPPHKPKPQ